MIGIQSNLAESTGDGVDENSLAAFSFNGDSPLERLIEANRSSPLKRPFQLPKSEIPRQVRALQIVKPSQ